MRPQLLKITSSPFISFGARRDSKPYVNNNWHYHTEIELIHVIKGEGTLFAGDTSIRFRCGDLILIGSQLPHYWRFDEVYTNDNPLSSLIELTQFCDDFWGKAFLLLPENINIVKLFEKAKRGIFIPQDKSASPKELLSRLIEAEDSERIFYLIGLLTELSRIEKPLYISSTNRFDFETSENERINAIYNYAMANFKTKIYLKNVALVANLSTNSFCRYFKSRTKKCFSAFIIEIRIGYACKLLSEKRKSIKEICFESGFNSFTNFNKQFKLLKGMKPNEYRKQMNFE
jgi:AraC-like DNA-binding protein